MITDNRNIKGFQIRSKEIKLTQYADDLTLLLSDMDSINEALSALDEFGKYSGLRINHEKTIGMLLGSWKDRHNFATKYKKDKRTNQTVRNLYQQQP